MDLGSHVKRLVLVAGILAALAVAVARLPTAPAGPSSPRPAVAHASALAATADLAAPAQSALDRILGPDHSVVTAYASYTQTAHQSSVIHGPKAVALSQSSVTGPGYQSTVVDNGVDVTLSDITPGGPQISRLTVAVVVDSALRPAPNLAVVRRTVSAALGLQVRRGDRISVAALPLPAAPSTIGTSNGRVVWTGYLPTMLAAGTALVLALVLLAEVAFRRGRRKASAGPAVAAAT